MLAEGDTAVYSRTGTTGKIVKIVELNGKTWVELDSTGLLYELNTLEAVAEIPKAKAKKPSRGKGGKQVEESLRDMKDEGTLDSSASVGGAG